MTPDSIPAVICTVDVVLLTLEQATLKVALVRREREPFAQALALPGGYIHTQDDVDAQASAVRVLRDKAGLESPYLEQLATFTGAVRDPRGWSVAVAASCNASVTTAPNSVACTWCRWARRSVPPPPSATAAG